MKSELIVNVQSDEISIALTEDDRLMEVNSERLDAPTFAVGNIYYGRVKKVMPALNAVFVDVGYEKEAFLHYLDLGSQFLTLEKFTQTAVQEKGRRPSMQKTPRQKEVGKQGSIADVCRIGQDILVQVSKEPINTKGPRLTAEISLAGRNMVLIPFGDKVMVSNKIKSEAERKRLKQLVQSIRPENFGVIVRTVAEGKRVAELDAELRLLVKRWDDVVVRLQKAKPVSLVAEEMDRTIGVIRDIFSPDFTSIYVNDQTMFEEVKNYLSLIAPESAELVHLYEGDQPIFDHFQITRQMKSGLGRTVGFKNGGYLIMERTEALFSIDVNSGSKKLGADQEDNAFSCNMLAADEIYHQLRLRDIGGIIIVDFIDMDSAEHRQLLFEHMRTLMKRDRARHNVLQLSKFGLMQITRQRVRPVVEVDVQEDCPVCHGKGRIEPSILFTDRLDEQIELYVAHFGKGLRLYVHPFVYAYAAKGFFLTTLKMRWYRRYGVRLLADESLALLDYRFIGKDGKRVELPKIHEDSIDSKEDRKAKLYATKPIEEKPEVKLPKAEEPAKKAASEQPKTTAEKKAAEQKVDKSASQKQQPKQKPQKQKSAPESPETPVNPEALIAAAAMLTENAATAAGAESAPKKSRRRRHGHKNAASAATESANPVIPETPEIPEISQAEPASEKTEAEASNASAKKAPKKRRPSKEKAAAETAASESPEHLEKPVTPEAPADQAEPIAKKTPKKRRPSKAKASSESVTPVEQVTVSTEAPSAESAEPEAAEAQKTPRKPRAPRKKKVPASPDATQPNSDKQEA